MPGQRLRQTSLGPGGVLTERQSLACDAKLREWRLENEAEHAGITVAELLSVHEAEREIEAERAELSILDYALSQTTLEKIFLSFASQQEAPSWARLST